MAGGLESSGDRLGRIDPSSLVRPAETVVEPKAVAALTDAFRQGIITADDITARVGQLGKSTRKAEIQLAEEAGSPEAQALRARQTAAGTEQAALQEAQAKKRRLFSNTRQLPTLINSPLSMVLQAPTLPDGTPDYKEMEKIGAQIAYSSSAKRRRHR